MRGDHVANSGKFPPSALGGDSMIDRHTEVGAQKNNAALAHPYHEGK